MLSFLLIGCGGAAAVEPTTAQNQAAETEPAADDERDAYLTVCTDAMARVTACVHDPAFLATQPVDMAPVEDELDALVGTRARADELCATLAADQGLAEDQRTYWNAYPEAELRGLADVTVGDCAATGAAFPGLLGENGGD